MSGRVIRPLTEADIAPLQALDQTAHGEAWSRRVFLDEVGSLDRIHLVAETPDGLVGHVAAWIDDSSCRITNVAVGAGHHGAGHATAMILVLIDQVLGATRVTNMQLEVRPSNRRAQRIYERFGFVPVGIERGFYERSDAQGSTDAVVMVVADVHAEPWRARLDELRAEHEITESHRNAGAAA